MTLKKELASLRACWNWAAHGGLIKGVFPGKGLRFPKEDEKEPFRTLAEVEAIIAAESPDEARKEALRASIYLSKDEIEQFLSYVKASGTLPWGLPDRGDGGVHRGAEERAAADAVGRRGPGGGHYYGP